MLAMVFGARARYCLAVGSEAVGGGVLRDVGLVDAVVGAAAELLNLFGRQRRCDAIDQLGLAAHVHVLPVALWPSSMWENQSWVMNWIQYAASTLKNGAFW